MLTFVASHLVSLRRQTTFKRHASAAGQDLTSGGSAGMGSGGSAGVGSGGSGGLSPEVQQWEVEFWKTSGLGGLLGAAALAESTWQCGARPPVAVKILVSGDVTSYGEGAAGGAVWGAVCG